MHASLRACECQCKVVHTTKVRKKNDSTAAFAYQHMTVDSGWKGLGHSL